MAKDFEDKRDFELKFTDRATSIDHAEVMALIEKLATYTVPDNQLLEDYCVVFTFYRRNREINKCMSLHYEYENQLGDAFYFHHVYSIAMKMTGRKSDIEKSVESARKSLAINPRHVGAVHNLANSLYLLAEFDDFRGKKAQELLREALDLVEHAIQIEPDYAKFYATRAQILSGKGNFDLARASVLRAVELEDSSRKDYSLRLSDYLSIKAQSELREKLSEALSEADKKIQLAVDEAKRSNLEVLTFFVAAVSFVIGSINIMGDFAPDQSAALIFVLSSALLVAVAGFSLLYMGNKSVLRFLVVLGLAALMLVAGLIVKSVWTLNVL